MTFVKGDQELNLIVIYYFNSTYNRYSLPIMLHNTNHMTK